MTMNISNLDEDAITNEKVKTKFADLLNKVSKIDDSVLDVNIEKHHTSGGKIKFSIKAKLKTSKGLFLAHKWGWNIHEAVEESVKALEREMKKKYEKERDIERSKGFRQK